MTSFDEFQKRVHDFALLRNPPYFPPMDIVARLAEEVGEFSREVQHRHGVKRKRADELQGSDLVEAADILFTLTCYINSQGHSWEDAVEKMFEKYYGRDKDRFKKIQ